MNSKKLIGAILGIIAFVALIAGATFAWLSVTANVTNQYNGTTKNFIINYTRTGDISNLQQLSNPTKSQFTTSNGKSIVKASKTANSAPSRNFQLIFNITQNTFVTNSVIYAVCKSTECPSTSLATVTPSSITCGGNVSCGKVLAGSLQPVTMLIDESTFLTDSAVSEVTYEIYFWIDSNIISNADMNVSGGAQINGNISASATQTDGAR